MIQFKKRLCCQYLRSDDLLTNIEIKTKRVMFSSFFGSILTKGILYSISYAIILSKQNGKYPIQYKLCYH